jgi:REP element-mobilizing transposase RayT
MSVRAAHIIITAYGFWLPNDPRGSWSDFVASWELLKFGRATKVQTRRSVAHVAHDRELRMAAKKALKYKPVLFDGLQARAIARGFSRARDEGGYVVHACSILPDHVHMVVAPHDRLFERITAHMKSRATRELREAGLHPFEEHEDADGSVPCVWAEGLWKVYCFDSGHVANAIRYVEDNPVREGKKKQEWKFVKPLVD